MAYLVVKVLYLINAIGQLVMMQRFLGFSAVTDLAYGFSVLRDIVNGHDWQVTQIFPRVGFCYVELKFLGVRTNAVTAQCALPLNMLNEKIYLFLWWWIMAAACITSFYLCLWIFRFSTRNREANYIFKYVQLSTDTFTHYGDKEVENFAHHYLRHGGIFLVRMVRLNAGEQVAAAVVKAFWERYRLANMDSLQRSFPLSNVPTAPASSIVPRDLYPQFKNFSKTSPSEKEGGDVDTMHTQAFV